jgi:hypothetical protein
MDDSETVPFIVGTDLLESLYKMILHPQSIFSSGPLPNSSRNAVKDTFKLAQLNFSQGSFQISENSHCFLEMPWLWILVCLE